MGLDFELHEHVATLTINRPERLNAMDKQLYQQLSEAWIEVRDNPVIRVAVITGAGDRAFTVGLDVRSYAPAELSEMWLTQRDPLLNRGLEIWKPIVAAVNGMCIGGGTTLLLATDIRVACADATFALAEVKRGLLPANGGTQRLISQLPYARAMELLLTGDQIDAATAQEWGLINAVVRDRDQLLPRAYEYAQRLAANAPLSVQATKELAIRSHDMSLRDGLRMEMLASRLLSFTQDRAEAAEAFAAKRPPNFEGR